MQAPRESIYAALFNLLKGLDTWNFIDRRFHEIAQLDESQLPAMMMCQKHEVAENSGRGIPLKWVLTVEVLVYVSTGNDPDRLPAQLLNPILDKLEAAIQPDVHNPAAAPQTLGGLVSQCRIRGEVMTDEGYLGNKGFIAVPVEIIVPA